MRAWRPFGAASLLKTVLYCAPKQTCVVRVLSSSK
ncbi:hypothetical protein Mgra_00007305 [Meloidogyne graminicola]|uniref:Uncharacterized protein n=1 Tax=Meloidogyne graminicola TaxID=189291 RepID=A0A8S9ZJ03_9BILA|nr:hypothetical protein Mgra_00007305 [Meloidogyne graminicola]